jgi:hypothetical protein
MIERIVDFLSVNNSVPVIALIILGVVGVAFAQAYYIMTSNIKEVKSSTVAKIEHFVDKVVLDIEEVSYVRASEIMDRRWDKASTCVHGENAKTCDFIEKYYSYESDKFRRILHESLHKTKESINTHIRINGFHKMDSLQLDVYCTNVGTELHDYNKRVMRVKGVDTLDLIKDTHELRFTKTEAIEFYRKIVNEVTRLKNEEKEKISSIKRKINFNGKLFKMIEGYLDG